MKRDIIFVAALAGPLLAGGAVWTMTAQTPYEAAEYRVVGVEVFRQLNGGLRCNSLSRVAILPSEVGRHCV